MHWAPPWAGASKEKLGQAACCAVKRLNLDQRIARCAQRNGANLFEKARVTLFRTLRPAARPVSMSAAPRARPHMRRPWLK